MDREITSAHVVAAALKGENPTEFQALEDAALGFSAAHRRWFHSLLDQKEDPELKELRSEESGKLQQAALNFADFIDRTAPK